LGSVLGGALSTAIETVKNGLQWVWDNVLVPLGEFIAVHSWGIFRVGLTFGMH
jgi:hypothetical protein